MRRWISLTLAALLVTVGLTIGASPAQADDSTCPSGYSCFWLGTNYTGNKVLRGAEWYGQPPQPFENTKLSVKNRFTNRTLAAYVPGYGWVYLPPGGQNPALAITAFQVL
jgi:hypothetical protein